MLIHFLYPEGFEKNSWFLSRLLLYVQVPHVTLISKHYPTMWVSQVSTVSDKSYCRGKYRIISNFVVICEHFNKIDILANNMVICRSRITIFKCMEIPVWWQGLKNSPTVTHACSKMRRKWVPTVWGHSWATLSPGIINTEAWSSRLGVGLWSNNPAL
jgi:hypothetical protein